ncbi:MAG: response regulator transcription factor [Actinomycetota bacterium]|nr:response regulator transcription factor [Actinomycetota bacterium]
MKPRSPVTVVIARFEDLLARGLRAYVEEDGALSLEATDLEIAGLDRHLAGLKPTVAILNFSALRSSADVHRIHAAHPATRLLVLADRPTAAQANQVLAFGATACLSKETQARDVLNAIHLASRGLVVLPRSPGADVAERAPIGPEILTPREAGVLELLQENRSNAEIAGRLHVGIETVRTHRRNIYRKLGVRTRRELSALSAER